MILNNFKKMISLNLTRGGDSYNSLSPSEVQLKKFFKDWEGNLCYANNWRSDGYEIIGLSNVFQSTFVGSYTLNDYTIALPPLQNEEDFLNNKEFLHSGRNYGSKLTYSREKRQVCPVGLYMVLGSGDTPPTLDDYKLDNWIPTAELSVQNFESTGPVNQSPPPFILSIMTSYKNNTENNITVKEVGLAKSRMTYVDSTDATKDKMLPPLLMVRDVLQNPVIIKPDEITSFTIVIK